MKGCDVQKLDELLHDDLLFNIQSGQTLTKSLDLEFYCSGKVKIEEISTADQQINIIDDTAIVSVTVEMKGMFFEHVLDGKYRINRVWKLCNDRCKVIAGSSIQF